MKKHLLATTVLAGLLTSTAAFAQVHNTVESSIDFRGRVTNAACTLAPIKEVDLGFVAKRALKTKGQVGPMGQTYIEFLDCNLGLDATDAEDQKLIVSGVDIKVSAGQADATESSLWANTLGVADSNVAVEVLYQGARILPDGTTEFGFDDIANNPNPKFLIQGRMYALGQAKEGIVGATLSFVAKYK